MKQDFGSNTVDVTIDFSEAGDQKFVYNGDNTINYVEVTVQNQVYRQTYGYTGVNITSISEWVKQ